MILYHGTIMDKAKEILDSKRLKCNIKRDFEETLYFSGTTDGYVYLTNQFHTAYYYGNIKTIDDCNDKYVCIFKMDIPENVLQADLDELKVKTRKEFDNATTASFSLNECGCVRCPEDICIIGSQYIIIPSTFNYDVDVAERKECGMLSKLQTEDILEKNKIYKKIMAKYKWENV